MHKTLVHALVFLALTAEISGEMYSGTFETPYTEVGTFLFRPSALKLPVWDFLVLALLLFRLGRARKQPGERAVARAMQASVATIFFEWAWGLGTGGSFQQTMWQLHPLLRMFVVAVTIGACLDSPSDYVRLGTVVLWSSIYRAIMLFGYWQFVVKETMTSPPPTLTTHHDTALFVCGMVIAIVWLLENRSAKNALVALFPCALLALAIVYNNRRLAWVSLAGALVVVYFMIPFQKTKRRLGMFAMAAAPFIVLYLVVGWERTEPMYKPAHAIATMVGKDDSSAATRDIENFNLIMTLKRNPLVGIGFGKEYDEISVAYSIKQFFEQYRYIPHNSVLGLLGFTGLVGFAGIWSVLPITAYVLARAHRASADKQARMVALASLASIAVFMNQLYGDMGIISTTATVLMACAIAAGGRLGAPQSRRG